MGCSIALINTSGGREQKRLWSANLILYGYNAALVEGHSKIRSAILPNARKEHRPTLGPV